MHACLVKRARSSRLDWHTDGECRTQQPRGFTERPHAPSGVAAFMSAHSKTPYITPSMDFSSGKGVAWGRRGQQLEFALALDRGRGRLTHRQCLSRHNTDSMRVNPRSRVECRTCMYSKQRGEWFINKHACNYATTKIISQPIKWLQKKNQWVPFIALSRTGAPSQTSTTIPAIPCRTIPYHAIPYHAMPCHTIPYHTMKGIQLARACTHERHGGRAWQMGTEKIVLFPRGFEARWQGGVEVQIPTTLCSEGLTTVVRTASDHKT